MHTSKSIKHFMTKHPTTLEPHTNLHQALEKMRTLKVTHLPVLSGNKLVGILSERDLMFVMGFKELNLSKLEIKDVMISDPVSFSESTPLSTVAQKMVSDHIGSVMILDEKHNLSGIFTYTDALKILSKN